MSWKVSKICQIIFITVNPRIVHILRTKIFELLKSALFEISTRSHEKNLHYKGLFTQHFRGDLKIFFQYCTRANKWRSWHSKIIFWPIRLPHKWHKILLLAWILLGGWPLIKSAICWRGYGILRFAVFKIRQVQALFAVNWGLVITQIMQATAK